MSGKNEWKELKIDKLPEDILTGDYEFAYRYDSFDIPKKTGRLYIVANMLKVKNQEHGENKMHLYYRKPEPKPPSHEEIMTKWWNFGERGWLKILNYRDGLYSTFDHMDSNYISWQKHHFTGRESSDIPPEPPC